MTAQYAKGTEVSVDKTRQEIERELLRFGADAFTSGFEFRRAFIMFRAKDRWIRLTLTLPSEDEPRFQKTEHRGLARDIEGRLRLVDAERRRVWRSLALLVKAKLAAVADGIVEFEQEFLPHIVMADRQTVWERTRDTIAIEYQRGEPQALLPSPKARP